MRRKNKFFKEAERQYHLFSPGTVFFKPTLFLLNKTDNFEKATLFPAFFIGWCWSSLSQLTDGILKPGCLPSVVDAKTMESLSFAHVVFKTERVAPSPMKSAILNWIVYRWYLSSELSGYFPKVLVVSDIKKWIKKFPSTQIPNSLKTLWFMPTMTISTNVAVQVQIERAK